MHVDKDKAKRVFRLVRELEDAMEQYCVDRGQSFPVRWENVVLGVEQMTHIRIKVERKLVEAQEPNAMVLRYSDDSADIEVRQGMTADLDNFTIIKEAMHSLVDQESDFSTDVAGTLGKLVKSSWFGKGSGAEDMDPTLQSEHLATVAAAAIVVPRSRRADYIKDITAGKTTIAKIAVEINVPERIVELALDEGFNECCEEAMKQPDEEDA
jgi:Zn-dependent peptidase ImmA (M78 family)